MLTPEQARKDYQDALTTLRQAALSPGISPEQRLSLRESMRELSLGYLDRLEIEIHALTAQYQGFIASMTGIVEDLSKATTPVAGLKDLTALVKKGAGLVEGAQDLQKKALTREFRARRSSNVPRARGAAQPLRILCVHGVGHQEGDPTFEGTWRAAIGKGLARWNLARPFEARFVAYDDLFAAHRPSAWQVTKAVAKLSASGLIHSIGDLFHRGRGLGDISEAVRWSAGMVVQWAEDDRLRRDARQRILAAAGDARWTPDVVLAHSLGSLLAYDAFARPEGQKLVAETVFATFGSQIGNPFVRSVLGGRILNLPAKRWYHLYNPHDNAFAAPIRLDAPNFKQVDAEFDIDGFLDHDAIAYLTHPNTTDVLWRAVAAPPDARGLGEPVAMLARHSQRGRVTKVRRAQKPPRRALLVGINDYPNPDDRLEGCVNDVFLVSSLLQESGFAADDIRVVLDKRATASGILERLEWLLDGAEDGQERVFYYSGHGAQIPGYGVGETVDRKDECLVPWDFDWTREKAVTDDQFHELYSQLPYGTHFLALFDCCHSGGMAREGAARVRGLTPPDDIRHRDLEWSSKDQMWVERGFLDEERRKLAEERAGRRESARYRKVLQSRFGERGDVQRLGVAAPLRQKTAEFDAACKAFGHHGPYMPVIVQACQEKQLSYEYRHGVVSHGAFTYAAGLALREARRANRQLTWKQLVADVGVKLERLSYDQTPGLVGPTKKLDQAIPWLKPAPRT